MAQNTRLENFLPGSGRILAEISAPRPDASTPETGVEFKGAGAKRFQVRRTVVRSGMGVTVLTAGHSNKSIEDFVSMLKAHGVRRLVDIRSVPRSRHNPQFNLDSLPASLEAAGIAYQHMPALGGLRRPRKDSINSAWRNDSFRGYADYMQTPEFEAGLEALVQLVAREQVVIMCAEAVPWRCHRSLIADALTVRGAQVDHIMSTTRTQPHLLTPFAKVSGIHITYPSETG